MEKFEGSELNPYESKYECDENGFVNFGDVARGELNQQSQYASRYVSGMLEGYKNLGAGLRFEGDPANYHELKIHKDDIEEFIKRVQEHRQESQG